MVCISRLIYRSGISPQGDEPIALSSFATAGSANIAPIPTPLATKTAGATETKAKMGPTVNSTNAINATNVTNAINAIRAIIAVAIILALGLWQRPCFAIDGPPDLMPPDMDDIQVRGNSGGGANQGSNQGPNRGAGGQAAGGVPITYAPPIGQGGQNQMQPNQMNQMNQPNQPNQYNQYNQYNQQGQQMQVGQPNGGNGTPPQMSRAMGGPQIGAKVSNDFRGIYGGQIKIKNKTPPIPSLECKIGNWYVMTEVDKAGKKKCYAVTYPYDSIGNHKSERKPYFMVVLTKRRISIFVATGYEYAKGSKLFVSLDGHQFVFETKEYVATPKDFGVEQEFVTVLLQTAGIAAYGRSVVGTYSVDSYSLEHFMDAYKKMIDICAKR